MDCSNFIRYCTKCKVNIAPQKFYQMQHYNKTTERRIRIFQICAQRADKLAVLSTFVSCALMYIVAAALQYAYIFSAALTVYFIFYPLL